MMTHRERALAALNHQEPDRVPIDLSGANGDAITVPAYCNLLRHLNLGGRPVKVDNRMLQTAVVDEDVLQLLDTDFRKVELGRPDVSCARELPNDAYMDEWGIVRRRPPGGHYYDLTPDGSPLREVDTIAGLDGFLWPDPLDPGRFRGLRDRAKALHEETDYAVSLVVNCCFFLRCAMLRGWENFLIDLVANETFAEALMDRYIDHNLTIAGRALEEAGEFADVVVVSTDDFGATDRLLISPSLFRRLIKPRLKRIFGYFAERTVAKRFLHSDGAIRPLLPDLVECGVEVLNPIQVSADGMDDTKGLKDEFGDRLVFWGAIDTHHVLPHGTPADVRREVARRIADLGPGGGYVLCSVHNIQPEVPAENVVAMFQAARELGQYPLAL